MYDLSVPAKVKAVEENARIVVDWLVYGTPYVARVEVHASAGWDNFVSVTIEGFPAHPNQSLAARLDATEGFALVLTGAKGVLESDVELKLVRDRFPDGPAGVAERELPEAPELESSAEQSTALPVKPEEWPLLFEQYLNSGDLDEVIALYEPEARFVAPSGEVLVGHDQMRKVIGKMIGAKTRLRARVVQAPGGPNRRCRANLRTTMDIREESVAISSKAIEVLRRQADGSWKLIAGNPHGRE